MFEADTSSTGSSASTASENSTRAATARVRAALAELLAAVDVLDCRLDDVEDLAEESLADLAEVVGELWESRSLIDAAMVAALDPWDIRRGWNRDGSRCATSRLVAQMRCSPRVARETIWRTRSLRAMPQARAAMLDGLLTTSMVDLLIRTCHGAVDHQMYLDDEEMLVGWCRDLGYHEARRRLEYWVAHCDPDHHEDQNERRRAERRLDVSMGDDGMVRLDGVMEPIGGAIFTEELKRIEHELYLADRRNGVTRTIRQRRADALTEMATRSRSLPDGAPRARPLITIVTGHADFARLCELANGTIVAPGQLMPLLSEAEIEHLIFDGQKRAVTASNRRSFTGALRRVIEVRDRHCQHPSGCELPASDCDIDHIVPRHRGGATDQDNGRVLCSTHNRNSAMRARRPEPHPAVAQARRRLHRAGSASRSGAGATGHADDDADHHR